MKRRISMNIKELLESLPARGAWIETICLEIGDIMPMVAPRTGGVD